MRKWNLIILFPAITFAQLDPLTATKEVGKAIVGLPFFLLVATILIYILALIGGSFAVFFWTWQKKSKEHDGGDPKLSAGIATAVYITVMVIFGFIANWGIKNFLGVGFGDILAIALSGIRGIAQ